MKKLLTLVAAGCMVLGSLGTASAVDVKVSGGWWFQYGYYSNNQLTKKSESGSHSDRVRARQRIRTQIEFIADENLKAVLHMENNIHWGERGTAANNRGGAIDSDEARFFVRHAYLDWTLPNTQTQIRMGMQPVRAPWVAFGNPVLDTEGAGVSVSTQLTPELGLTGFWVRAFDGSYTAGQTNGNNSMDDMDVFGLLLPIKTDVVRATPWGMIALIGRDSDYWGGNTAAGAHTAGAYTTAGSGRGRWAAGDKDMDSSAFAWWAGTTLELPILDPFFVKIDAMMGAIDAGMDEVDSFGWMVAADIGYKFSFGSLSAIGWYASGDKDDDDLGIMPMVSSNNGFKPTRYGTAGTSSRSWDRVITENGLGMWGIGLQLANVSFVDNLSHTARVVYMGGTNKGEAVARRDVQNNTGDTLFGNGYLMTSDRAWEINLLNQYKVSQNLTLSLDLAYVWLDLGDHWDNKEDTKGSFATMLGVAYSF